MVLIILKSQLPTQPGVPGPYALQVLSTISVFSPSFGASLIVTSLHHGAYQMKINKRQNIITEPLPCGVKE